MTTSRRAVKRKFPEAYLATIFGPTADEDRFYVFDPLTQTPLSKPVRDMEHAWDLADEFLCSELIS